MEYHPNGQIWTQKTYNDGRLTLLKEYYSNGSLRMQADYSDALMLPNLQDKGSGTLYRRNGHAIYDWQFTNLDSERFRKFYDDLGKPSRIEYYSLKGELTKTKKYESHS